MQLVDIISPFLRNINKSLEDVQNVRMDHPTDPHKITICFVDNTEAIITIQRPKKKGN